MRGAVRVVAPLRSVCMRERAYNFSAYFKVGAHAPYCTNDCQYAIRRILKLETAYHSQRVSRLRAIPACVSK
jgi:hypothetical protein